MKADEKMIEAVARVLEPQAWAALETGDTLAYKNRRTSSLRKADKAITAMLSAAPTDYGELVKELRSDLWPSDDAVQIKKCGLIRKAADTIELLSALNPPGVE